jgi:hypothetical protein
MFLERIGEVNELAKEEVGYGEPSPEAVYKAAYNVEMLEKDKRAVQMIIEELPEISWMILSVEHGIERRPVKEWMTCELSDWTLEQLRDGYRTALEEFRREYSARPFA